MEIVQNSNGILTVRCYDKEYPIGKKIEWTVKVGEDEKREIKSTYSDNAIASINLSWKDDLKLGKRNTIVCRVFPHPSKKPNWQEKTAWIYEEDVLKFCECEDCGTEVPELTNANKNSNAEPNSIPDQKSISNSNQQTLIIITSLLSSVILIFTLTLSLYYVRKRKQQNTARNNGK